jgi:hypothetical protein
MFEPRPGSTHDSDPQASGRAESAARAPDAAEGAQPAQSDRSGAHAVPDAVEVGASDYVGRVRSRRARLKALREQLRGIEDRLASRRSPVVQALYRLNAILPVPTYPASVPSSSPEIRAQRLQFLLDLCGAVREGKFDRGIQDILAADKDETPESERAAIHLYKYAWEGASGDCLRLLEAIDEMPTLPEKLDAGAPYQVGVWGAVRTLFNAILPWPECDNVHAWHPDWVEAQALLSEVEQIRAHRGEARIESDNAKELAGPRDAAAPALEPGQTPLNPTFREGQPSTGTPATRRKLSVQEMNDLLRHPIGTPRQLQEIYDLVADAVWVGSGNRESMTTAPTSGDDVQATALAFLLSLQKATAALGEFEIWLCANAPGVRHAAQSAVEALWPINHAFVHVLQALGGAPADHLALGNHACPVFPDCSRVPLSLQFPACIEIVQNYFGRVPDIDVPALLQPLRTETLSAAARIVEADTKGAETAIGGGAELNKTLLPARHSADFRSVHWYGKDYTFTPTQAACVKLLWGANENGTPELGQDTILLHPTVEAGASRLRDVFKGHPAWDLLIVKGTTQGAYRLAEPPKKN